MMAAFLESGFCHTYVVKLLFTKRPKINIENVMYLLHKRPESSGIEYSYENESHVFSHKSVCEDDNSRSYAQTCVLPMTWVLSTSKYEDALLQNRDWKNAQSVVEKCRYSITIQDSHASKLAPSLRLEIFNRVLKALVESTKCDAIYFQPSDKLVSPKAYLSSAKNNELLYSIVNVRIRQEGSQPGSCNIAYDTLGLAALGLPDIQFNDTNSNYDDSVFLLYQIADRILKSGDQYEDGQICALQGKNWICRHKLAHMAPQRYVLDLSKNDAYSATILASAAQN